MKIANVADIHARGKDLSACRDQLAAMVAECIKRQVALVTIAGDIFDRASIGDNHASTGAIAEVPIRAVAELTKHGIEVLMIPGNHDVSGAGSADALHVFDGMAKVHVVRDPCWWVYTDDQCDNVHIFCLPWSWSGEDPGDILWVQSVSRKATLLLAHVRVTGAKMSRDFTCDAKPGTWQVSRGFLELLPFDHFALGDFHARQNLTNGRGGYVGAIMQHNFGEEGNPAGFEVWNTETNETEWVELDAAPRYQTTTIDLNKGEYWIDSFRADNTIQRVQ
ncbi:MAG TPA: metallophosphoesterase, partial [Phycisphaerae bacterium]|nr:metallophosphoesterase [Phycisphaerae bacterium]